MPENTQGVEVGDVVQIDPSHNDVFGACLLIVTELKSFGVMGYVRVPGSGDKGGDAYYRVPFDRVHRIGRAEWIHPDVYPRVRLPAHPAVAEPVEAQSVGWLSRRPQRREVLVRVVPVQHRGAA